MNRRANDHYHCFNPKATGSKNQYLDKDGNPVLKGNDASHLYPPEGICWDFY